VVTLAFVGLASQGLRRGRWRARCLSRALGRTNIRTAPAHQFPPHSAPSLVGRGWQINCPLLGPPSVRAERGPDSVGLPPHRVWEVSHLVTRGSGQFPPFDPFNGSYREEPSLPILFSFPSFESWVR